MGCIKSGVEQRSGNVSLFKRPNIKNYRSGIYAIYIYKLLKFKDRLSLPIKTSKASLLNVTKIFLFKDGEINIKACPFPYLSSMPFKSLGDISLLEYEALKYGKSIYLCMKHNYLRNFIKFHISYSLTHISHTGVKQTLNTFETRAQNTKYLP